MAACMIRSVLFSHASLPTTGLGPVAVLLPSAGQARGAEVPVGGFTAAAGHSLQLQQNQQVCKLCE